ncbi:HemK, methyltransferase [Desulfamplus magnetovallimortis]|uniref:Release factor glutamine methyltransferase n=1 Tax=Desulfamplus magnetovallimortis TaxID=1246637 RepID=A0A1W1H4J3_9BACT|nr:peptide chain release factor N(5)-glutamine methyltransferase [Desulfamplus magnetovallimortis]SLM27362.1 HemK, methyltransferase [Desulfamplus magnetovallimortis]
MSSGRTNTSGNTLWTIVKVLQWSEGYFKKLNVDSPRLTAEILLSHVLDIRRLDLYLQFDRPLNPDELAAYKELIKRRVNDREPVAYITGERGFWNGQFMVSPYVLIPRPDTETLVEQTVEYIRDLEKDGRKMNILDLGTGSGAVIVSLSMTCPGHSFFASDISMAAVEIARQNYVHNCLSSDDDTKKDFSLINFWVSSWLESVRPGFKFDIIVSNPPYIPSKDIATLQPEIRDHEPLSALDGGHDGFDSFRRILAFAVNYLKEDGYLLMEMGSDQRKQMEAEVMGFRCYAPPSFIKDYAGHDRLVVLRRLSGNL